MKGYVGTLDDGRAEYFVDRKRRQWLWSLAAPLQPVAGILMHAVTGYEAWLLLPLAVSFVLLPLADALAGEDDSNPPPAIAAQLEADPYYRYLTFAIVPVHFAVLIVCAWYAATQDLSVWGFLALALVAGVASGLSINTGHELAHKKPKLERLLAKFALAVPAYGHFWIEHNYGHHINVATPADPASARMGESIYRFALREIPGTIESAWAIETERLARANRPSLHWDNQILQSLAVTVLLQGGLIVAFGAAMVPFLIVHNLTAWWQLTSANYVEHYGLLRQPDEHGRPERCEPHHSWNSSHLPSNLMLFHLQRHSDHHTHPRRRYQVLRHYPDLPTLPTGYPGCYLLAWIPPLWFRVMNPRLLSLSHVAGDMTKVNTGPAPAPAQAATSQ